MEAKVGRCYWKDVSSAIVIWCVWVAHLGGAIPKYYWGEIINPCFFLLSGCFAQKGQNKTFKEFVIKNGKRLLIPYVGWICVNTIFQFVLYEWNAQNVIDAFIMFIRLQPRLMSYAAPLWFLMGIFVCKMLYEVLRRIVKNIYVVAGICFAFSIALDYIALLGYSVLSTGYILGIYYMFYYSMGPICAKMFNLLYERIHNGTQKKRILCMVFCLLLLDAVIFLVGFRNIPWITNPIAKHLILAYMTISFLILTLFIKSKPLEIIGQNTMVFCGMETIMKTVAGFLLSDLGLSIDNDIKRMIYVSILFVLMYKVVLPMIKKHIPVLS